MATKTVAGEVSGETTTVDVATNRGDADDDTQRMVSATASAGPTVLDALDAAIEIECGGASSVMFWATDVSSFLGVLASEAFINGEWVFAGLFDLNTYTLQGSWSDPDSVWLESPVGPFTKWRLRVTTYTSGSVTLVASANVGAPYQAAQLATLVAQNGETIPGTTADGLTVNLGANNDVDTGLDQPLTDAQLRATPVDVDGSGVTQPVSAASLPLPTGAATAALQGGGLPSALASDRLKVDGSGVTQPVSGTVTATGPLTDTQLRASAVPVSAASLPLPSGASTSALQGGGLPAALGAGGGLKVDGSGTALPVSGTVTANPGSGTFGTGLDTPIGATNESAAATDTSTSGLNGLLKRIAQRLTTLIAVFPTTIDTNSGNKSASTLRVVLATDQPTMTNSQPVNAAPRTSGGLTIYKNLDIDETGQNVKNAAGQLYGYIVTNAAASARYLKLYNKATAPTVGTDTPVITITLLAGAMANVEFTNGIAFATGIGVGCTTGVADNSTGAPGANDVQLTLLYA